jgi:predicted AAA+ superfamily ATPase
VVELRIKTVGDKATDYIMSSNSKDTMEEKLSLADRFGITISFFTPNQKEFLIIVDGIIKERGVVTGRNDGR